MQSMETCDGEMLTYVVQLHHLEAFIVYNITLEHDMYTFE